MHLFFDLDNTLWDFDKNSANTLATLYDMHALDQKLRVPFAVFFEAYLTINDELWNLYYFKKIAKSELRWQRFYKAFAGFGYDDEALSRTVSEQYLKEAPYCKDLVPGCKETLEALAKKYTLHIITNGFAEVQNIKLDTCGLRPYFSQIIISEEYGFTKPNVEIFRLAEKLAGTTAEKSIMIGDNPVSDIDGAVGAGWRAIYYNYRKTEFQKEAVSSILHLNELHSLL